LQVVGAPFVPLRFVAVGGVFGDLWGGSSRGVTMGVEGPVLFGGVWVGPLVFGPIVQGYGYAAGFTACAVAAMALVLVTAMMQSDRVRRRSAQAPLGDSETQSAAARQA